MEILSLTLSLQRDVHALLPVDEVIQGLTDRSSLQWCKMCSLKVCAVGDSGSREETRAPFLVEGKILGVQKLELSGLNGLDHRGVTKWGDAQAGL